MRDRTKEFVELGTIAIAVVVLGIMAGFFWTYTFNVNLAMQQVDAETYAIVQSLFNQNVRHPMFFVFFFGGGFFPVIALLSNLRHRKKLLFWLLVLTAVVYILGVIVFTQRVNLPLNDYTESWQPASVPNDWMDIRDQWNAANALRVGTSFLAFILSVLALVLRASPSNNNKS